MHDIILKVMTSSHYAVLKVIMSYNGNNSLLLTISERLKFHHIYCTSSCSDFLFSHSTLSLYVERYLKLLLYQLKVHLHCSSSLELDVVLMLCVCHTTPIQKLLC